MVEKWRRQQFGGPDSYQKSLRCLVWCTTVRYTSWQCESFRLVSSFLLGIPGARFRDECEWLQGFESTEDTEGKRQWVETQDKNGDCFWIIFSLCDSLNLSSISKLKCRPQFPSTFNVHMVLSFLFSFTFLPSNITLHRMHFLKWISNTPSWFHTQLFGTVTKTPCDFKPLVTRLVTKLCFIWTRRNG